MGLFKKKPTQCNFDAAMVWDLEAGEVPKFEMTPAYNGGKLSVRGFDAPVVVELNSARFEKPNLIINADHDSKKTVGHAEFQEINEDGIFVTGLLSKLNEHVDRIVTESKQRFPHEASIEASFPPARLVKAGHEEKVNGKVIPGPFYLARNAVITGVAILDRGADRHTNVSIAAELDQEEYSMNLNDLFAKHDIDPSADDAGDKLEAAMSPNLPAPVDLPAPVATAPIAQEPVLAQVAGVKTIAAEEAPQSFDQVLAEQRQKLVAERKRTSEVERICAEEGNPEVKLTVDGKEELVDLQAHAIINGWDVQKTQFEVMKWKLDNQSAGGHVGIQDATKHDENVQVIECALALSAGLDSSLAGKQNLYDEQTLNIASEHRFLGIRPSELVNRTILAAGMATQKRLNNDYIRDMQTAHRKLQASGFTTFSVPGILSNVANKTLLAAYRRFPSFIPFVFGRTNRADFKPGFSYQLEGGGRLLRLGKDGEIKHGTVIENQYTSQLETFARMLAWTREDMINDDLGALGRTSDILGTMAFKAREFEAARTVIQPTTTFWVNGVNSFTNRDFGIDGMTASDTSFDGVEDGDGLPISVGGGNVLLPHVLKMAGNQLANSTTIETPDGTGKQYTDNPHAGTFEHMSTPWINNAAVNKSEGTFTGLSAGDRPKTWYRFADPQAAPALEVLYLNGVDTPTIESDETDFNTLGMQFRCYFDFSFGANDSKFAQRNIGA